MDLPKILEQVKAHSAYEYLVQGRVYSAYYSLWFTSIKKSLPVVSSPYGLELTEWIGRLSTDEKRRIEASWLTEIGGTVVERKR